ncbi:MAG: S41 family peptidase [Candidatus Eremiobacteraeota bacterium]|nr:S41 family peptidase [Candidatus Eremiobacteraeota bacterium]
MNRILSGLLMAALVASLTQMPAASSAASTGLSTLDAAEIQFTYGKIRSDFYRRSDPQAIVAGAREQMQKTLRGAGVRGTLPPLVAAADPAITLAGVDREVNAASRLAGSKVSSHLLAYAALMGMLSSVHDKYTVFLTPKEYAALNEGLDGGTFSGTGIVIEANETSKLIDVTNVVPGGPAERAGIQQDDVIVAIDGISTRGMTVQQASGHLRGKEGSGVLLSIMRDGRALRAPIAIVRAVVHQLSVYSKMLSNHIGYVALTVFGKNTGAELATALDRLQQQGSRAIVMDLRDNGGGYLDAAIAVSSKFIASGPIVSVESRASNITTLEADATAINPLPLAVLVNGHTASASEITSGAIQDSGTGTIIGTKTYGKGVVQSIWRLPDDAAVKITTARYLTPRNRDINHIGIMPDIIVPENKNPRYGEVARDVQLQRAIIVLTQKIARADEGSAGT